MRDVQRLQDMLAAVQQQRDAALNAVVVAQAEIAALRRENAALKGATADPVPTAPQSNGAAQVGA